jgi:vitamin B12 transporter
MNCSKNKVGIAAWKPLALASALPMLTVTQAVAQDDFAKTLAPVVVTASRLEQAQTEALPHTTIITEREIRSSQAVDLPSLLKHEAGIQFTQNGGYGQASGLFVRGAETRQTLILLDGAPLTKQDATGTVSIEHLMLDQVERIEVVRGNVSSIYGSSGIGGVVQIFTKRGEGPLKANAKAEVGSRDTRRLSAGISGSTGATRYSFAASDFQTDGYSSLNTNQVPVANPDKDGYRNTSVSGSLSNALSKGHEVGLRFSNSEGKFDFDSNFSFGLPTDRHTGNTDVNTITAFSNNRIMEKWRSRLSYSESRDRNSNRYETSSLVSQDRYRSFTRMLQWNNEISISPMWTGTVGYERQWQKFDSEDDYGGGFDVNRNANSIYAGIHGRVDAHQLQLNVRHDDIDKVDSATTGYLGYGYNITSAFKLIGNLSSGFSAPPLGYLYAPFGGNPDLKPEHSRSIEAGAQYSVANTLLRATIFKTRVRDQLQYDPATFRFGNIARARNKGLELSATQKWTSTDVRASLTLQDPRDDITGERLRRRAKTLAALSLTHSLGALQIGADLDYTGKRKDLPQDLGSYWTTNLTARYGLSTDLSIHGRIENLFDREYQTAYGYNQSDRGIFVGLNWQMQ